MNKGVVLDKTADIQFRVDQMKNSIGMIENDLVVINREVNDDPPPPPIGTLTKPTKVRELIKDTAKHCFIFTKPIKLPGATVVFVNKGGMRYIAQYVNGTLGPLIATDAPYGDILFRNGFKSVYNIWNRFRLGYCNTYSAGSSDGLVWADQGVDREQFCGEDRTFNWDDEDGLYKCYIRPLPPGAGIRTIGYMESANHASGWSRIIDVLRPEADESNTEFYRMSVVKTSQGYFGLLNVYKTVDNGLVELQLVYSANGKDNWIRCNNRLPFIDRPAGYKQMFGNWFINGTDVEILTFKCKTGHDEPAVAPDFLHSDLYRLPLSKLLEYKP